MEIRAARTCFAVTSFLVLLGGAGCGSGGQSMAAELGQQYKLSPTDVAGWQLDPNDSANFQVLQEGTPNNLESFMDGNSDLYTNAGCTISIYESLVGPTPYTATFYAMYFGTAASATAMFSAQQTTYAASDTIPGFDSSVAIGFGGTAHRTIFAHFDAMYIELVVTGYGSDSTSAYQAAAKILTVLKAKTN
jgi:hypothetical protein